MNYQNLEKFKLISFYRFTKIKNKNKLKFKIENLLVNKLIKGTILLSDEGINGSLCGKKEIFDPLFSFLKKELKIRKLNSNITNVSFIPFNRLKVRLKKEIVSLGKDNISVKTFRNNHVTPSQWHKILQNKKFKIIDVRNDYEVSIGKFKNSIKPNTKSFRQFPDRIKKMKISKEENIGLYCTGGIRCEKASDHLKKIGYKNIYQLEGGIINYLKYMKNKKIQSMWIGECFVFDDRVTINKNLDKGKYLQCYGCRRPIQKKDTKSIHYKKGVHCSYCYKFRTQEQIKRSTTRQQQIDNAIENNLNSTFIKEKY